MAQCPNKHCSKCGKKGQDVRGAMLGHERIIISVHRTRLDMKEITVVIPI